MLVVTFRLNVNDIFNHSLTVIITSPKR